ncbi:DUF3325 family protein [Oceanimonas baumannii]|uniref:DUF3325 family protein n=1 Tax=Oceanimonas baumannii TaxID=129578 RepID=UPI001D188A36|nr:DUF3325 family protein [Oceanimonas baumannii]MCC4264456.1 DUF3325 family protein [Oceanimonas baumannii]
MLMAHLVVFILSMSGFQLLAMATSRGKFWQRRDLFWSGWLLLLAGLMAALSGWRPGLGLTLWLGYLSAGAGVVFLVRIRGRRETR